MPAERWAYFLQNADRLTPEEVCRIFPDEEIAEAAGVLEMTSEHLEQLARDNARLKFQRVEEARLIQARLEGKATASQSWLGPFEKLLSRKSA